MSNFKNQIQRIQQQLREILPGRCAQLIMSPSERPKGNASYHPTNAVDSAVLVLLYPNNNSLHSVLMQRPSYPGVHGGQVSFPGGKRELEDNSLEETALRESHEELGIVPDEVKIIGKLSKLYIPHSNYMVHPYVGYSNKKPEYVLEASEVDEAIDYSVDKLVDHNYRKEKKMHLKFGEIDVPYFDINQKVVWGATAMMLSEFAEVLKRAKVFNNQE